MRLMNMPEPAVDMNLSEKAFFLRVVLPKKVVCDCLSSTGFHTLSAGNGRHRLLHMPKDDPSEMSLPPMVLFHSAKEELCEWTEL